MKAEHSRLISRTHAETLMRLSVKAHPSSTGLRGVVECERVGTAFIYLFALDYIKTWLRSYRCASDADSH